MKGKILCLVILMAAIAFVIAGCSNGIITEGNYNEGNHAEEKSVTRGVWYNSSDFEKYLASKKAVEGFVSEIDAAPEVIAETSETVEEDLVVTWAYILNDTGDIGIVLLENR